MTKQGAGTDWEAIERDYRTGQFSLRELEAKYGVANSAIQRKATKKGWQRDLTNAVRRATNSKLIAEIATNQIVNNIVSNKVLAALPSVSDTVSAAAEINKQIILKHRSHIGAATEVAMQMLEELTYAGQSKEQIEAAFEKLNDTADDKEIANAKKALNYLLSLHSRVGSIHKLADTLTKVQTQERKAFGIADETEEGDKKTESAPPVFNITMK